MKQKHILIWLITALPILVLAQSIQSPDAYLGYDLGKQFTPHHKIVSYCKKLAESASAMVKMETYGTTTEGRELLLMYISSPENIRNLDAIRRNNLYITGLLTEKAAASTINAKAIVWLSYNVHGNEPSSSEAALKTLYELVNPDNASTKEWLKNTVVIIDPCLNPDGRDRYVNWYNGVAGKHVNNDPQAREHTEPYPQGRTNHYNFDLNRDWAWQTQNESIYRMKKYNEWMPHVHVDFHEQGYNEPYYFAPAAEPFHESITPWQRSFQTVIGKNNAKYFDENGWLFFTKERFDLFYPSYGDTYPTFNGSVGMTYEQAGIRAGLGIQTDEGDTLTLTQRIQHHFTTGLSTIETASKNREQIINEFQKYFDDAAHAKNALYKTYIVTSTDENKILAVKTLLDKNGIEYGTTPASGKAYRYFTNKEEDIVLNTYSLAISMYQPKSTLVKVLFEPISKLIDSATYDITAWSIPFSYGVEGFASKEAMNITAIKDMEHIIKTEDATYGYIIPYTSFNSTKLLAFLLKNKVKVRIADKPFNYNTKTYSRGTLIVLKSNNTANWMNVIKEAAQKYNIAAESVKSGFVEKGADFGSPDVRLIHAPNIAVFTGDNVSASDAGEVWNLFEEQLDYPITLLNAGDISRLNFKNYQVIIMPDGNYKNINDKAVQEKLQEFVKGGGRLIAMQNAVSRLASGDWNIKHKADKDEDKKGDYALVKKYADREREDLPKSIPGAIYKVELDNTHPMAYGFADNYYTLKQDANIYEFMKEGWNVGILKKENYVTGFSGNKVKNKLKDGMIFGAVDIGSGKLIVLTDNPLFRLFWENGKMLFGNAVFMVN